LKFESAGTPDFWRHYHGLPDHVQVAARKAFRIWSEDALHPSLHFKKIGGGKWSARVGIHYRAVGKFVGDTMFWDWIGSHGDYDGLAK
jgi:hypothetical protein